MVVQALLALVLAIPACGDETRPSPAPDASAADGGDGPVDAGADDPPTDSGVEDWPADASIATPGPSDELYALDHLPRFDLALSDDAIAALRANPYAYVSADLTYGDETVTDVGVRLKGMTSFQPIDGKPSFKVKFDEFVAGQDFRGLRRMVLNNSSKDSSFLAERVAYRVFRAAGLPAPRANNALVYVNGDFYGVYVNVEAEDKTFLRRWFVDDSGNLYESDFQDIAPGSADQFDLETNEAMDDRSDLEQLLDSAESSTPDTLLTDVGSELHMGQWLRYWAVEAAVLQRDGYAFLLYGDDVPGNFRLYHDPERDRFVLIPWSMDRAMKPPHMPSWASYAFLTYNCLQGAVCMAAYQRQLGLIADLWESLPLLDEMEAARQQIEPWVELDTRRPVDPTFDSGVARVADAIVSQPEAIRGDLRSWPSDD